MTAQADFSEDEWEQILEGPTSAGLLVVTADSGGSIRETFSMAKAYTEARQQRGQSELLDTIASTKPVVDKDRPKSSAELKEHALQKLRDAIALLEQKATPEEVEDYRQFVIGLAERVARAHKEHGQEISDKEQAVIDEIAAAVAR
ncbi:MAG: hypothetical protein M3M99_07985 [Actinomycetota bacterium]|nr:hypothetical protein [Actinomycetota bacterium]